MLAITLTGTMDKNGVGDKGILPLFSLLTNGMSF